ncbi:hypothetical protein F4801DRAFT_122605 [Xylaria longipes]|nr:hypothetical protein F4801DRAFT_122605 [Xylaria longipes]RYC62746.1 hypothetical protein CHU98_g3462 [Xylaria longipes]
MASLQQDIAFFIRTTEPSITTMNLVMASLYSADAQLAAILRGRAKSDLANATDAALSNAFITAMEHVFVSGVLAATTSVFFAAYGVLLIAIRASWIRKSNGHWMTDAIGIGQFFVALSIAIVGGGIPVYVYGFQAAFDKFGSDDNFPYYNFMYYGGMVQSIYGYLQLAFVVLSNVYRMSIHCQ